MKYNRFSAASIALALLLAATLAASALSCSQKGKISGKIEVAVSVPPLADFVENIGGERVEVSIMVPTGADPHTYEPKPSQMVSLAKARMYVKLGSGIEFELAYMDKIAAINKAMTIVDCSKDIPLITSMDPDEPGMDPHIWLSPLNAKIIVRNISDGLVQVDPDNRAYYERNRDAYLQELTGLDQDIRNALSKVTNRSFMVYHPSFGYFAGEYNLTMLPIEEEGKEPTAAAIANLIEYAKEHKIKVIFASPQFNPQSAQVIAEAIGGKVIFIDPLAKDYITNLRRVLDEMVQAME